MKELRDVKNDPNPQTKVATRFNGDIATIDILGDLTPLVREAVEAAYNEINAAGAKKLLLTFTKDAYINSGGIAILISVAIAGSRNGQKIRIVQPSEHFQKIFSMVGLQRYLEVFQTESEAVAGF